MIIDYVLIVLTPRQILGSQSNCVQIVVVGGCPQRQDSYGRLIYLWAVAVDGTAVIPLVICDLLGKYEFNASRNCRVGLRYQAVHKTPYRQASHPHTGSLWFLSGVVCPVPGAVLVLLGAQPRLTSVYRLVNGFLSGGIGIGMYGVSP